MLVSMIAAVCALSPAPKDDAPIAEALFKTPPAWAKPHTWWHWMGGNVSKEGITADLEAMKFAGIGGGHIFDAGQGIPDGPIKYNSPEWRELMAWAMKEAQRLGLDMTMHNCSGWSSSGGPWVQPDDAMKRTTYRTEVFDGPGVPPPVPEPPTVGGYYKDIATFAIPYVEGDFNRDRLNSLIGLSGNPGQSDDLKWPVVPLNKVVVLSGTPDPRLDAGRWVIVRLGYTLTGAHNVASRESGDGLEVDKLSAKSLDNFLEGGLVPLFKAIGEPVGKSFRTVLIDSYETGFQNWTPSMIEDFKKLRGYDPTPYLPALAGFGVSDKETTLKFLFDFRRTIAELWAKNYSGHFAQRLKKYGLQLAVEPYGNGSFDPFTYAKPAGLIMGEYWVGEGTINGSTKQSSSVAHVYGHSVVGAEALTAAPHEAGWRNQPRQWKPFADRGYINGINRIIYHRMAHQPWVSGVLPGMTMGPWGSHVDRTNTFWPFMPQWDLYLSRCQYLLQSGVYAADVLLFTGESSPQQYTGEGYALPEVPQGYAFDYIGADPLMALKAGRQTLDKRTRPLADDGSLILPNGASYKVLALPASNQMTLAAARKIKDLVLAGATVCGPKPTGSPSLQDGAAGDAEVKRIGERLWGKGASGVKKTGQGKVYWGMSLTQVLSKEKVEPDFLTDSPSVSAIHRKAAGTDLYFVTSLSAAPKTAECTFRVNGKVPELWNAETGETAIAPEWQTRNGKTVVRIRFESNGSAFVVFRNPVGQAIERLVSAAVKPDPAKPRKPLAILSAVYGDLSNPDKTKDVTRLLQKAAKDGGLRISASNNDMGGDPAYLVVKSLKVTYKYGDETKTVTIPENGILAIGEQAEEDTPPAYQVKGNELWVWKAGTYRVSQPASSVGKPQSALQKTAAKPKAVKVDQVPAPVPVEGRWIVRFAEGWDAPSILVMEKLASWTENENEGVKYYSGTATYSKTLRIDASQLKKGTRLFLDLGDVRELCRIKLNGKLVASLWKPPFRVDITDFAKAGDNELIVEVTNLWTNRLIGDEQYPDDMGWEGDRLKGWPEWFVKGEPRPEPRRKTFTTWRHVSKDTPLLPSGILGPVVLRQIKVIPLN